MNTEFSDVDGAKLGQNARAFGDVLLLGARPAGVGDGALESHQLAPKQRAEHFAGRGVGAGRSHDPAPQCDDVLASSTKRRQFGVVWCADWRKRSRRDRRDVRVVKRARRSLLGRLARTLCAATREIQRR